jgi:uncharacterized protein
MRRGRVGAPEPGAMKPQGLAIVLGPGGEVRVRVKTVPGASRDDVVGVLGDRIKVKVAAPPEGGRANRALLRLLAERLGLSPHALRLVSGETQPLKVVGVRGRTLAEVGAALGVPPPRAHPSPPLRPSPPP